MKQVITLSLALLVLCTGGFGQIDSLDAVIQSNAPDTARINASLKKAGELEYSE